MLDRTCVLCPVDYGTVWYGRVWVRHGMAGYGYALVWSGMWYGIFWYGMVWQGSGIVWYVVRKFCMVLGWCGTVWSDI